MTLRARDGLSRPVAVSCVSTATLPHTAFPVGWVRARFPERREERDGLVVGVLSDACGFTMTARLFVETPVVSLHASMQSVAWGSNRCPKS